MLNIRLAAKSDLSDVVQIAISSFLNDRKYVPSNIHYYAPPGHDDVNVHKKWMDKFNYYVCLDDDVAVATCILDCNETSGRIHGIHVHELMMNRGIGSWIIRQLTIIENNVSHWHLETPDYAIRNHHFYRKNGFTLTKSCNIIPDLGFGFYHFEKYLNK